MLPHLHSKLPLDGAQSGSQVTGVTELSTPGMPPTRSLRTALQSAASQFPNPILQFFSLNSGWRLQIGDISNCQKTYTRSLAPLLAGTARIIVNAVMLLCIAMSLRSSYAGLIRSSAFGRLHSFVTCVPTSLRFHSRTTLTTPSNVYVD